MDEPSRYHETPLHASRKFHRTTPHLLPKAQVSEEFFGAGNRFGAGNTVIASLIDDDVERLLEGVEIHFLTHKPYVGLSFLEFFIDIVAENLHRTTGFIHEGRCDADDGRFSSAIRSQKREEIADGYGKRHAFQSDSPRFVNFLEVFYFERRRHTRLVQFRIILRVM